MLRYILILNAFTAFCTAGPDFPATKGEVWPKPQYQVKKNTVFSFDRAHFQIKVAGFTCPLLSRAAARYSHLYARQSHFAYRNNDHSQKHSRMGELHVNLTGPCENYPQLGMHEGYNLTIAKVSTLQSSSIWGILRGLQTVLHSFYICDIYGEILINATEIVDYPRFSHRGLLLDTSRHYISLQNILSVLDAMEMNKMNVFHWHIVDDESFPYQSQKLPELSEHAAYRPTMVYSKADIMVVVKYARELGIRIIPEFDVPGHTLSWGVSHPEILTKCIDDKGKLWGALNPVKNATFDLLRTLVKEVQGLFPDKSFHVGGDEVFATCWDLDPTIQAYVKEHNMRNTDVFPMFMNRLFALFGARSQPTVWQDVFENMSLPANIPVQIWRPGPFEGKPYADKGKNTLNTVLEAGNKAILSAPWYLFHVNRGFWDYYNQTDPEAMVDHKSLVPNVLGGEACMWTESVDDSDVISRIWPRASATAEILWSSPPFDASDHNVNKNRLKEQTHRMLRHNIDVQTNGRSGFASSDLIILMCSIFIYILF